MLLERTWKNGDEISLEMDMPVQLMEADPRVREDVGKVAVTRGPVVYCLEEADNGDQLQENLPERRAGIPRGIPAGSFKRGSHHPGKRKTGFQRRLGKERAVQSLHRKEI